MVNVRDRWAAGATYEVFMGRWSRGLAPAFVAWLGLPAGLDWLDVGCGTGSLTQAIVDHAAPASVVGCDPAEPFIAFARDQVADARVSFLVAGVGSLPRRPGGYGSVASLLALNFFPNAGGAIDEMRSIASVGGTVSACVWDYANGMQWLRKFWDAAIALDPAADELDEGRRFSLCRPDALLALFREAGLGDVRCEPIDIRTPFASFQDYWQPFLGGTGPAPSYVASLDADRRAALERHLHDEWWPAEGGSVELRARAWAVRGTAS